MIWCGLGEAVKRCPQCALDYNRISRGTDGLQIAAGGGWNSNFWYRGTQARDFRNIPGIAGRSSSGEGDVGGGLRRRRQ